MKVGGLLGRVARLATRRHHEIREHLVVGEVVTVQAGG